MNPTMNGSGFSPLNSTAEKIGKTSSYCLIFVVSLVGNSFIGIVVYKTQTLQKLINYFIVNMAMSDLLYAIFFIPWNVTELLTDSWLVGGPLGQSLCKLLPFLATTSVLVSVQSLVLIAVDRFAAVVFPLRSPLISSKMCSFFILATWIVAMAFFSPYLFVFKRVASREPALREYRMESSLWRVLIPCYLLSSHMCCVYLCPHRLVGHTILYHRCQAQASNLLNTQGNGRASFNGMKPLESPRLSLVTR